jgi:hypothetical protein
MSNKEHMPTTSLDKLVEKFSFQEFEPKGRTECEQVRFARSVVDYCVRWMQAEFSPHDPESPAQC